MPYILYVADLSIIQTEEKSWFKNLQSWNLLGFPETFQHLSRRILQSCTFRVFFILHLTFFSTPEAVLSTAHLSYNGQQQPSGGSFPLP